MRSRDHALMRSAADFLRILQMCCEAVLYVYEDVRKVLWVWIFRKLLGKEHHVLQYSIILSRVIIIPDLKLLYKWFLLSTSNLYLCESLWMISLMSLEHVKILESQSPKRKQCCSLIWDFWEGVSYYIQSLGLINDFSWKRTVNLMILPA